MESQLDLGFLRSDGSSSSTEVTPLVIWTLSGTKKYPGLGFQLYHFVCMYVCTHLYVFSMSHSHSQPLFFQVKWDLLIREHLFTNLVV